MNRSSKFFISLFSFTLTTVPALVTFAAATVKDFKSLVSLILIDTIIKPIVPLLVGLAVVVFIYGVLTTVMSEGDKKEEGKQYMFWGIVGIFVMVSVWGLVSVLSGTFNLDSNTVPVIKMCVPGQC